MGRRLPHNPKSSNRRDPAMGTIIFVLLIGAAAYLAYQNPDKVKALWTKLFGAG
jgi:hypothetical protein